MQEIIDKNLKKGKIWFYLIFVFAAVFFLMFLPIGIVTPLFFLVSSTGSTTSLVVYLVSYRQFMSCIKWLQEKNLTDIADDVNLERATLPRSVIHCGARAFYSYKSKLIIPYEEILWAYRYERRINGFVVENCFVILTRDGKKFKLKVHIDEFVWLLKNYIARFSPDVIVGYGPEQISAFQKRVDGKPPFSMHATNISDMEYREYQPRQVKNDITANKLRTCIAAIPLIIGVILAAVFISMLITERSRTFDLSNSSYNQFKKSRYYRIEELVVVEKYDYSNYLVMFTDKDGRPIYTSLSVNSYQSPELQETFEIVSKPGFEVGSLVLSGVFFAPSTLYDYEKQKLEIACARASGNSYSAILYADLSTSTEESAREEVISNIFSFSYFFTVSALVILLGIKRIKHFLYLRKQLSMYLEEYYREQQPVSDI